MTDAHVLQWSPYGVLRASLSALSRRWIKLPLIVRYGLAGGTTQVVYFGTFLFLVSINLPYFAAVCAAQLMAIAYAFPLYRDVVFRASGPIAQQFATFLGIWWIGGAISVVGVPALVEGLGVDPRVAQMVAQVAAVGFGFLGHCRLTFRARRQPDKS